LVKNFNIRTAASYFAATLKQNTGNVLASIGDYNGWFVGMTYVRVLQYLSGALMNILSLCRRMPPRRAILLVADVKTTLTSTEFSLVNYNMIDGLFRFCSLHQFLNGWMQNINAYEAHLGKYFNLDSCPG
jgi:hypothetical protein